MSQIENDDPQAPAEELSLRGQIEKAIEETNAKTDIPQPVPEGETEVQKEAHTRDEQGRFAKAEAERKAGTITLPDKPASGVVDQAAGPAVQSAAAKAPDGWPANLKPRFADIPADLQAVILKREEESHRRISANDEDRTFGKAIREATNPYMATILAEGATPVLAYTDYLKTAYMLRTGTPQAKSQALQFLARQFNVPMNVPSQQGPQQVLPPQIQSLMEEVENLKRERQTDLQQRQSQEVFSLQSEIDAFAAEAGHEHFEVVKPHMSALLQNGLANNLQDAYDQAVWARPDIRSTLQSQVVPSEAKRLSDIKARSDAARRAAGSVTGSPGLSNGLDPAAKDRPLRDEIRAQLRAATGRV